MRLVVRPSALRNSAGNTVNPAIVRVCSNAAASAGLSEDVLDHLDWTALRLFKP